MQRSFLVRAWLVVTLIVAGVSRTDAQVLGPFSWQMQPYCDVVTLTLRTAPAGFMIDGTDDQCGAVHGGGIVGVASFGTNGQVALNFTIVLAPSSRPVHVSAIVNPGNGQGSWTDSAGNSGTFAFFANTPGLPARPLPASGLPAASVTAAQIAPGTIGAGQVDPQQVQRRVSGHCAVGTVMWGIAADGTVSCDPLDPAPVHFRASGLATPLVVFSGAGGATVSTWSQVDYNVGGGTYDAATGQYTTPEAGLYLITATVRWHGFTLTANEFCTSIHAGTDRRASTCLTPSTTTLFAIPHVSTVTSLPAGAVVRITGTQSTGANATIGNGSHIDNTFTVTRLR